VAFAQQNYNTQTHVCPDPVTKAYPRNVIGIGDKSAMVLMDKLLKKI
jgi:hypothetical protein